MSKFELDPNAGPHAASGLSNEELEYLHRVISLEMAVRMRREDYTRHFKGVADAREQQDEMIDKIRTERERMYFVASVTSDLENLPLTTDRKNENESYGMYL